MAEDLHDDKPKKERSPSFPFISLRKAIERAEALIKAHKREPARLSVVGSTWGYGPKSSGLLQTVAALKQFGLIEDLGSGEDRKIVLSDLARRILLESRPGAREQAIKEAAKNPRLIAEYTNSWLPERPSDAHCTSELQLDRGFSPEAARLFLKVFDETVTFSGLENQDREQLSLDSPAYLGGGPAGPTGPGLTGPGPTGPTGPSEANEWVQWSQGGPPPSRVWPNDNRSGVAATPQVRAPFRSVGASAATLPLPEGIAILEIPPSLSAESFEDLKAWVEVLLRRAERSAKNT